MTARRTRKPYIFSLYAGKTEADFSFYIGTRLTRNEAKAAIVRLMIMQPEACIRLYRRHDNGSLSVGRRYDPEQL